MPKNETLFALFWDWDLAPQHCQNILLVREAAAQPQGKAKFLKGHVDQIDYVRF